MRSGGHGLTFLVSRILGLSLEIRSLRRHEFQIVPGQKPIALLDQRPAAFLVISQNQADKIMAFAILIGAQIDVGVRKLLAQEKARGVFPVADPGNFPGPALLDPPAFGILLIGCLLYTSRCV